MCRDLMDEYTSCGHVKLGTLLCRRVPNCNGSPVSRQEIDGYCPRCTTTVPAVTNPGTDQNVLNTQQTEGESIQQAQTQHQHRQQYLDEEEFRLQRIPPQNLTQRDARLLIQTYIRLSQVHFSQTQGFSPSSQRLINLQNAVASIPHRLLDDNLPGKERLAAIAALRDATIGLASRESHDGAYGYLIEALRARYTEFVANMEQYDQNRRVARRVLRDTRAHRLERAARVAFDRMDRLRDAGLGAVRERAIHHLLRRVDVEPRDSKCGICMVEYGRSADGQDITHLTLSGQPGGEVELPAEVPCPTRHAFGRRCLVLWLRNSPTCPICRYDLSREIELIVAQNPERSIADNALVTGTPVLTLEESAAVVEVRELLGELEEMAVMDEMDELPVV